MAEHTTYASSGHASTGGATSESRQHPDGQPLIGGRYALGELLGRGGMAEVRKGTDTRLGRTVAVKRLRTDLASDATFQARFRREAQSAASLNHPAIVAVYDTGEEPASDGSGISQPYIVMEFVAGRTLRDILREGRKILPERALEITSGVLSALDYSHRAGIIHRDIKPGNVMLTPAGDVKVMDFGIARAISDASSTMTQTAAVVGTAQYLSPEQARGEPVDSRSRRLLRRLPALRAADRSPAVHRRLTRSRSPTSTSASRAAPPSDHDTDLPPEVDAIVMKSLAKRVEDRYQSAAAMRGDIERYLAGHPVHVTPPPPLIEPPTTVTNPTAVVTPVPPPEEPPRRRSVARGRACWSFLAILLVIVLGLAAYLLPKMFASPTDQVQVPRLAGLTGRAGARRSSTDAGLQVGTADHAYSTKVARQPGHRPEPGRRRVRRQGHDRHLHAVPRYAPDEGAAHRRSAEERGAVGVAERASQPGLPAGGLRPAEGDGRQHRPARRHPGRPRLGRDGHDLAGSAEGARRGRPHPGRGRADDQGPRLHPAGEPGQQLDRDPGTGHGADASRWRDPAAGVDGLHPGVDLRPDLPADVTSHLGADLAADVPADLAIDLSGAAPAAGVTQLPASLCGSTWAYCRSVRPSYAGAVTLSSICSSQPTLMSGSAASAR